MVRGGGTERTGLETVETIVHSSLHHGSRRKKKRLLTKKIHGCRYRNLLFVMPARRRNDNMATRSPNTVADFPFEITRDILLRSGSIRMSTLRLHIICISDSRRCRMALLREMLHALMEKPLVMPVQDSFSSGDRLIQHIRRLVIQDTVRVPFDIGQDRRFWSSYISGGDRYSMRTSFSSLTSLKILDCVWKDASPSTLFVHLPSSLTHLEIVCTIDNGHCSSHVASTVQVHMYLPKLQCLLMDLISPFFSVTSLGRLTELISLKVGGLVPLLNDDGEIHHSWRYTGMSFQVLPPLPSSLLSVTMLPPVCYRPAVLVCSRLTRLETRFDPHLDRLSAFPLRMHCFKYGDWRHTLKHLDIDAVRDDRIDAVTALTALTALVLKELPDERVLADIKSALPGLSVTTRIFERLD
jgi:hypothetical protein